MEKSWNLIKIKTLKGEVGDCALNIHGDYIVDHGKSWSCVFEFLWKPCLGWSAVCGCGVSWSSLLAFFT